MIDDKLQREMLAEYDQKFAFYENLANTVKLLLENILVNGDVKLHTVTHRCKSRESLAGKVARLEKNYADLSDITDLAAVRITTYFDDDVDHISETIKGEFNIVEINDKRISEPDRLGYRSLHFVASLRHDRQKLAEYARFGNTKFEIQVRSILQHAWAEIEHDLGYKAFHKLPYAYRRQFTLIAGLLEVADKAFTKLRLDLKTREEGISDAIEKQPENVALDEVSIKTILGSERSAARRLSMDIARLLDAAVEDVPKDSLEFLLSFLDHIKITTAAELEEKAAKYSQKVQQFAKKWFGEGQKKATVSEAIGILFLSYVLIAETEDPDNISSFLKGYFDEHLAAEGLGKRILDTYRQTKPS